MPQTYPDIPSTDTLAASRQKLLDRDEASRSSFSGTAFPTSGLVVGMRCHRTDLNKIYVLKDTTPTWIEVEDISASTGRAPNAANLGGYPASTTAAANTIPVYNASAQLVGSITGNAATATTLATARSIGMTGDVSWSIASFNGSANVTAAATLANTAVSAGSYTAANITVDSKGRITAASSNSSLVSAFNGRTGSVTLSSGDVTGALGYTPMNSGNQTFAALNINSGAPQINLNDSDWGTRYIHNNSGLVGDLNNGGGWAFYNDNSGNLWSAAYGWLHDYFFRVVTNCAIQGTTSGQNISNCVENCTYFGDNVGQVYSSQLLDEGANLRIRTLRHYVNCNCACTCK